MLKVVPPFSATRFSKVKGPKYPAEFQKQRKRSALAIELHCDEKIVSSHLHPVENSKRLLSSIFVFHRHAAETGSISEYNLKEATKSHIIVNY